MTDNEIIKALENEIHLAEYVDTSYVDNVSVELLGNALDLINRQKSEIDQFADIGKMYSEVRAEAIREFAEKLKEGFNSLEYNPNTCRKTFDIDVVKSQMDWILHEVTSKEIDRVVKEMVGEDNA